MISINGYAFDPNKNHQTIYARNRTDGDKLIEGIMQYLKTKKGCRFESNTDEVNHNPFCLRSMKGEYEILKGMTYVINVRMFVWAGDMNGKYSAKVTVQL